MTASISSDPPVAPVALSFADEPAVVAEVDVALDDAPTEPEPPRRSEHRSPPPKEKANRVRQGRARATPSTGAQLCAWTFDAAIVLGLAACDVYVAGRMCRARYWLDFVRDAAPLWVALAGAVAVAYSWVFVGLGGRTPGMALAGLRVRTLHGDDPTPAEALGRAALALPSAALGLFGFVLALFDARGQTLHDKLCRCVIRID